MESYRTTLVLLLVTVLICGAGGYVTFVQQPEELENIEETRRLARMQQAEVQELLVEHSASKEAADQAVRKWNARYKFIPEEMNTPDIVQYLESLTRRGFEAFNIRLVDTHESPDVNHYSFEVEGTAYYTSLYDFVWHIENNRDLYRIRDLSLSHTDVFDVNPRTGEQRRKDMVKFQLYLDAYYSGREGLSEARSELVPISRELLPSHDPAHNSFYPIVREDLPPNDEMLVNVEEATLVSIAGDKAIFEDERGQHSLSEGDRVYLGSIVKIDPANVIVRASLNKGGVVEVVDVRMEETEETYRQSTRGHQLVPIQN